MFKTDSRKVNKGDTFVALRGISSDGHKYIEKAIESGASKIICEEGNYSVPTIIVEDSRKYLEEELVKTYKDKFKNIKLIGITGTNGKSSIGYLLYQLLNYTNHKSAYVGTVGFYLENNVIETDNTTPDICEMYNMINEAIDKKCEYFILEASSQGLSYGRLNGLEFDCAIFTNLTMEHLDFHKTMENYALAKQQLFLHSKCSIVNVDDPYKDYFMIGNTITYGFNSNEYKLNSFDNGILKFNDKVIKTNFDGLYNAYNLLAVIACLDYFHIENYINYMDKVELPNGRLQKINYKNNIIIIDYAHTPDALEKVIDVGRKLGNNVITIFGCTGDRLKEKRPVMGDIATSLSTKVIITKDNINNESIDDINKEIVKGIKTNNYEIINDRALAIKKGMSYLSNNDVLLILGKGHETYMEENNKKFHFNDYEEVIKLINEEVEDLC